MAVGNITSANATLTMVVEELFPAGVGLEQFATDQSFSQDHNQITETRMGVDGQMVAGFVPNIKAVTVMLEASSPSFPAMVDLHRAMEKARTIYPVTLTARIPSINQTITWTNGVLHESTPVPAANQVLAPTTWVFHFQDMIIETSWNPSRGI